MHDSDPALSMAAPDPEPPAQAWGRVAWGLAAAALSLVVTAMVWRVERQDVELRVQARFDFRIQEITAAITARMAAYDQVLRGGTSLVTTLGGVSREQWRRYVAGLDLQQRFPGFQGVGYAQYLTGPDRAAFEARMRAEGVPAYAVRPPGERDLLAPVTYLEPGNDRNQRALGFDMLSEPVRAAAMLLARDSGLATVSGKLKLASEAQQSPVSGFLLYLPVYRPGVPLATVEARRAALIGFVNSPFRINDLLTGALGAHRGDVNVRLFDGSGTRPEALMHDDGLLGPAVAGARYQAVRELAVAGRTWTLQFDSLPGLADDLAMSELRVIGLAGLGVSGLVGALVWATLARLAQTRRERANYRHLALTDPLTGLPNRAQLNQALTALLAQSRRQQRQAAVLFLDLDNFKAINDRHGHEAGDRLLQAVSRRMTETARAGDLVGRLGGDEFCVLLGGPIAGAEVTAVAERLIAALGQPYSLAGVQVQTSASLGVAMFPADGTDAQTLLKHADSAMYRAKLEGKARFQFYSAALNAAALRFAQVEQALRQALDQGALVLRFQPVVDLADGRIAGMEAMTQLGNSAALAVADDELWTVAEQAGLAAVLSDFTVDALCRQLAGWQVSGIGPLTVGLRLSARQLTDGQWAERLHRAILAHGVDPHFLELELTEATLALDPLVAQASVRALAALGLSIVMADFGRGRSTLAQLREFPVRKIKFDSGFVDSDELSPAGGGLAVATVAVAASLSLELVAAGLSTPAQRAALVAIGCKLGQGPLISPALSADDLIQCFGTGLRRVPLPPLG